MVSRCFHSRRTARDTDIQGGGDGRDKGGDQGSDRHCRFLEGDRHACATFHGEMARFNCGLPGGCRAGNRAGVRR